MADSRLYRRMESGEISRIHENLTYLDCVDIIPNRLSHYRVPACNQIATNVSNTHSRPINLHDLSEAATGSSAKSDSQNIASGAIRSRAALPARDEREKQNVHEKGFDGATVARF
jgi:hypothetical protein